MIYSIKNRCSKKYTHTQLQYQKTSKAQFVYPIKSLKHDINMIWVFPKIVVSQNGWFIMENPIKMDDLGENPTIFGNIYIQTPIQTLRRSESPTLLNNKHLAPPIYRFVVIRWFGCQVARRRPVNLAVQDLPTKGGGQVVVGPLVGQNSFGPSIIWSFLAISIGICRIWNQNV